VVALAGFRLTGTYLLTISICLVYSGTEYTIRHLYSISHLMRGLKGIDTLSLVKYAGNTQLRKEMVMKTTKIVIVTIAVLTSLLIPIAGCGPMRTQTYDFTDFTGVEVGYAFQVEITRSDSYSISITAPENVFNVIQVSKAGETLKIGLTSPIPTRGVKASITMPDLRALKFSGATKGTITGFSSSNDFNLDLSGASNLEGDIQAGDAVVVLSGASKAKLEGSAKDINVNASGASGIDLSRFPVNNAQVLLSGASNGTVNLNGRLDADLSGALKLSYIGEPTMGDINTSGASTLSKK